MTLIQSDGQLALLCLDPARMTLDEDCASGPGKDADPEPGSDLPLGDKYNLLGRIEGEDVQPRHVIGDNGSGTRGRLALNLESDPENGEAGRTGPAGEAG